MDARFVVFGFQASGKTTFAAALWHLLDSREVPTALQKGKHTGDFSYLEEIAQAWSEGWELDRTKTKQIEAIRINLLHAPTKSEVALEFTELSGETFESAFATRLCSPEFVEMAKRAEGLLLFVSASRVIELGRDTRRTGPRRGYRGAGTGRGRQMGSLENATPGPAGRSAAVTSASSFQQIAIESCCDCVGLGSRQGNRDRRGSMARRPVPAAPSVFE